MTAEFSRQKEISREILPGITQEIRGSIVLTRCPDFTVQVALARSHQRDSIYKSFMPDGQRNIVSAVDLEDGRYLVVNAPPEITVRKKLSEARKNSEDSDAVYVVEYKTEGLWLLVQRLYGKATRHSHYGAVEAFTLLEAEEYGIHDEENDKTELFSTNGLPKFVDIRKLGQDHQCFSYKWPSFALIVLAGEDVKHDLLPSLSEEELLQRAERYHLTASAIYLPPRHHPLGD